MKWPAATLTAVLALGTLAACAGVQTSSQAGHQQAMGVDPAAITDAIDAMVKVFPPALTPLVVRQAEGDAFGRGMLDGLRARGYAITELSGTGRKSAGTSASFQYRMAPIADTGMYELLLSVGDIRLSRVYVLDATENRMYPGGEWSRKE